MYLHIGIHSVLVLFQSRENIRVMSCLGQVLSVLPYSEVIEHLNPILTPQITDLAELLKQRVIYLLDWFSA